MSDDIYDTLDYEDMSQDISQDMSPVYLDLVDIQPKQSSASAPYPTKEEPPALPPRPPHTIQPQQLPTQPPPPPPSSQQHKQTTASSKSSSSSHHPRSQHNRTRTPLVGLSGSSSAAPPNREKQTTSAAARRERHSVSGPVPSYPPISTASAARGNRTKTTVGTPSTAGELPYDIHASSGAPPIRKLPEWGAKPASTTTPTPNTSNTIGAPSHGRRRHSEQSIPFTDRQTTGNRHTVIGGPMSGVYNGLQNVTISENSSTYESLNRTPPQTSASTPSNGPAGGSTYKHVDTPRPPPALPRDVKRARSLNTRRISLPTKLPGAYQLPRVESYRTKDMYCSKEMITKFQKSTNFSDAATIDDLQKSLKNLDGSIFNMETSNMLFDAFDTERKGFLTFEEFSGIDGFVEAWKSYFLEFKPTDKGVITKKDLYKAFNLAGYQLSNNFSSLCCQVLSRDMADGLRLDDFIQCFMMVQSLHDWFTARDVQDSGVITLKYDEFLRAALDTVQLN